MVAISLTPGVQLALMDSVNSIYVGAGAQIEVDYGDDSPSKVEMSVGWRLPSIFDFDNMFYWLWNSEHEFSDGSTAEGNYVMVSFQVLGFFINVNLAW